MIGRMQHVTSHMTLLMTLIYREPSNERDSSIRLQVLSQASDTAVHMYERGREGKRERDSRGRLGE